jgi:hypothetical protein
VFRDQLEALLPVVFGLGAIGLARNPQGLVEQIRSLFADSERSREPIGVLTRAEPVTIETIGGRPVAFPDGTLFHNVNCLLAVGKEGGHDVGAEEASRLRPCPVCKPAL